MATPTTRMPAPWPALTSRGVSPTEIVAARSSGAPAASAPRSIARSVTLVRSRSSEPKPPKERYLLRSPRSSLIRAAGSTFPETIPWTIPASASRGRISSIPGITR